MLFRSVAAPAPGLSAAGAATDLPPTGPLCSQRSTAGVRDCDAAALRGLSAPHILKLVVLLRVSSACSYIQRWRT